MKNMPEEDIWDSIRKRLYEYQEEPDDEWDKISGALAESPTQSSPSRKIWLGLIAVATLSTIFFFLPSKLKDEQQSYTQNKNLNNNDVADRLDEQRQDESATALQEPLRGGDKNQVNHPKEEQSGYTQRKNIGNNDVAGRLDEQRQDESATALQEPLRGDDMNQVNNPTSTGKSLATETSTAPIVPQKSNLNSVISNAPLTESTRAPFNHPTSTGKSLTTETSIAPIAPQKSDLTSAISNDPLTESARTPFNHPTSTGKSPASETSTVPIAPQKSDLTSAILNDPLTESTRTPFNHLQPIDDAVDSVTSASAKNVLSQPLIDSADRKDLAIKQKIDSAEHAEEHIIIKEKKKRKFDYYAMLSPSLSYYAITAQQSPSGKVNGFESKGTFSENRLGVAFEAGAQFTVAKKLQLFTGLSYYCQNQTLNYRFIDASSSNIEETPGSFTYTITPGQSSVRSINYRMNNLRLSAGILYEVKNFRGWAQKIGGSLTYERGVSTDAASTYGNAKSSYWGYQLLYRMEFSLNRSRKKIFVQPAFTNLFGVAERLNEPITVRPVRAGLGIGLIF